jgi:hypothetical protein
MWKAYFFPLVQTATLMMPNGISLKVRGIWLYRLWAGDVISQSEKENFLYCGRQH